MNYLIVGNVIALIASLMMVYSGILKNKKQILYIQTIQCGLSTISNLVLGGITGAIINIISCIRNIICYKNKLFLNAKIILTLTSGILTLKFNNLGLVGLLPGISTITYIWLMNTKNIIIFKILIIFTMFLWLIYDLTIKSYTSALFDFFTILTNMISILEIYLIKKNK